MVKITFPVEGFPYFDGRRPTLVSGKVTCEATRIEGGGVGELGKVTWRIVKLTITPPKKGTPIDLSEDSWIRQDFERWLRGHHGHAIERQLRGGAALPIKENDGK